MDILILLAYSFLSVSYVMGVGQGGKQERTNKTFFSVIVMLHLYILKNPNKTTARKKPKINPVLLNQVVVNLNANLACSGKKALLVQ